MTAFWTIKEIEKIIGNKRTIVDIEQHNKWIVCILDNSMKIKIKNF